MGTGLVNGAVEYKRSRGREAAVCYLIPPCEISDIPSMVSAMPHSTLQPTSAIWRSVEQARRTRLSQETLTISDTASLLPDEKKRLTQLFQEIEAIISEMDPRSPDDIRKQIEKHGIIPRVRHSIDMSVAEWRSVNSDDRGVHLPPQGWNNAVFVVPPETPPRTLKGFVKDAEECSVGEKKKPKTKPLDVQRPPGDRGKQKGKGVPEPAPAVLGKRFATPISDRYRTTLSGSPSSSAPSIGISRTASTASASSGSHYPPTPDSRSVDSQASRFKPLPPLPPGAKATSSAKVTSLGNVQPFKYSEFLNRVVSLAPYLSDRSRKAFTIIAQEIDWWDDQFEQEFGHRCEAVHLPGYPLSAEDVRAYYKRLAEDSPTRPPSMTPPRSIPGDMGARRSEQVDQPVFRPEENTTLKKANEARELQRAASLSGRGSPLR